MEYGLIGKTLKQSFSKEIHESFNGYKYELRELSSDELEDFILKKDFKGINVTIPYKQDVIKYLDFIDEKAEKIGAVNTVLNKNGKLYGYNTDYYGLKDLILKKYSSLYGKNVLILGAGGTSKTAFALAEDLQAKNIFIASRSKKVGTITYDEAKNYDIQVIINTTPVGMFPNINISPIDINEFDSLESVFDAVYNPLKTKLVIDAQKKGIYADGGLYMLVSQAFYGYMLFSGKTVSDKQKSVIYNKILQKKKNIVLIGMPGSGKTTVAKILSDMLKLPVVDTDKIIAQRYGEISDIFEKRGEKFFRDSETQVIKENSVLNNVIISTGGGAVLKNENIDLLKSNGTVFFINRAIEKIVPTDNRPLSRNKEALQLLFEKRYDLYKNSADYVIDNNDELISTCEKIERLFKNEDNSY